jgi:hypothetical protein
MGPSNERELDIARVVDRVAANDTLGPASIDEIFAAVAFSLSRNDCEFLVNYIRWRIEHPIAKQSA